ncbi:MAG: hypothetical protein ACI4BI_01590 [Anaerotardibacter sp.]
MINWERLEDRLENRAETVNRYYELIAEKIENISDEEIETILQKGVIFSNYNTVYDIIQDEIDVTDEELAYLEEECDEEFSAEWSMFSEAEYKHFIRLRDSHK